MGVLWRYLAYKVGYATKKNRDEAGGASVDFLMFSGYLYMAYMFLKMVRVSLDASEKKDLAADFTKHKLHTSQFFFDKILPRADMHAKAISAGSNSLMEMPVEYFA